MIERIRLRNFRRLRDARLEFRPGANLIEGPNNVGKTTLLYAIEYAFFGRVENFKSLRPLAHAGNKSLGVELVFIAANGERFLLQRVHMTPPKSRKAMEGHFTLKALLDDGERYLLASDFGDTEDKLALKLQELTGLTRRFFSVALHMRQGEIPAILGGAKELDIVLGVTAAAVAEDELRQMALELEKEAAGLDVLQERVRAVGNELNAVAAELASLANERQETSHKLATLGTVADPRVEFNRQLTPLLEALDRYEKLRHSTELARRSLADEQERHAAAGALADIEKERVRVTTEAGQRTDALTKLRGELEQVDAERRTLDLQRGDLAGRIERRKGLPRGKGAKCEVCGAAINASQTAKELKEWTAEMAKQDEALGAFAARQAQLKTSVDRLTAEERKRLDQLTRLDQQHQRLTELEQTLARRQSAVESAVAAEQAAYAGIGEAVKQITPLLERETPEARWNLAGEPAIVIASVRETIHTARQVLAERVGRQVAQVQALTELLMRLNNQAEAVTRRQTDLEREQAAAQAQANAKQAKADRAERFRKLSAGFKDLQVRIRTDAATKLAAGTLDLHRRLSDRDEFTSLTIDPNNYAVQVVPRDVGEEVPAALYEGGGHRLLLGLSFRLAVARLLESCPFILLDEPTYGLDLAHREALLDRIADPNIARQILLVTHHARTDAALHRIRLDRSEKEMGLVP
jgi:DNA repair exonuclease SbcCD ATPase subunit